MDAATDWDVIVVGAGHNGLAATALLARRGFTGISVEGCEVSQRTAVQRRLADS